MPNCAECGEELDEGHMFCPNCGADLDDRSATGTGTDGESWGATNDEVGGGSGGSDDVDDGAAASTDEWGTTETGDVVPTAGDADAGGAASTSGDDGPDGDPSATAADPPATDVEGPSPHTDGAFSFAAKYAVRDGYDPLLIGSVIYLGVFLVPVIGPFLGFFVRGYGFRLTQAAARGQTAPPEFDDYGDLFVDGLKLFGLGLLYGLAFLFVAGLTAAVGYAVHEVLGLVVLAGWVLVAGYFYPAVRAILAATDSFEAALSPERVAAFAFTGTYLKAYLLWIPISILVAVVALASLFTIVGIVAVAAWALYLQAAYWGYHYREAVAKGEVPSPPSAPV